MSEVPVALLDVNALVALTVSTHQHHRAAHVFLGSQVAWATCPMTEAGLIRILLNPLVAGRELRQAHVQTVLSGFRRDQRWRFVADASTLADPLVDTEVLMGRQQVTDLHLVNLAATTGCRLATFDAAMVTWLAPGDHRHVQLIPA